VDFLGLRQVNIDMMAGVLPGINVTWIRPFSVVSWIHWKFYELAAKQNISEPSGEQLRVWKEKVETLLHGATSWKAYRVCLESASTHLVTALCLWSFSLGVELPLTPA
jgi:hypothetical protein